MKKEMKHVVIIGAGFSGLFAAKKFFGKSVKVTLIDKNNYHTFNPLLYQVGAAEIEPDQIAYPVRTVIRGRNNINFLMSEVTEIKFKEKRVITGDSEIGYDYLIIAPGSELNYFGINGAAEHTVKLKKLDEALYLRNHILSLFEKAERCSETDLRKKYLTFVIVGGGPTGVEFAGAFAELVKGPLKKDFPGINQSEIDIRLVDAGKRILSMYSEKSGNYAVKKLTKMGVRVMLEAQVDSIGSDSISFKNGESISSDTILWSAGVKGLQIKNDLGAAERRDSRIAVDNTLRINGFSDVFVCGDLAFIEQDGIPLPMVAPVASQEGEHAAKNVLRLVKGKEALPFRFGDRGSMVTIGRNSAITKLAGFEMRGFLAWILWIFVHIFYLIGFRNKVFVLFSWFIDYLLFERSGRMIIPACDEDKC